MRLTIVTICGRSDLDGNGSSLLSKHYNWPDGATAELNHRGMAQQNFESAFESADGGFFKRVLIFTLTYIEAYFQLTALR
jgi:hypothetical protein